MVRFSQSKDWTTSLTDDLIHEVALLENSPEYGEDG
jgi:hypothetical protein